MGAKNFSLLSVFKCLARYVVVGTLVSDVDREVRKLSHGETVHDRSDQRWVVSVPGCKESDFTVSKFGGLRGRSSNFFPLFF